jgi:hypothetical protein
MNDSEGRQRYPSPSQLRASLDKRSTYLERYCFGLVRGLARLLSVITINSTTRCRRSAGEVVGKLFPPLKLTAEEISGQLPLFLKSPIGQCAIAFSCALFCFQFSGAG